MIRALARVIAFKDVLSGNPAIAPSGIHFYDGTRYPSWRGDLSTPGRVVRLVPVE